MTNFPQVRNTCATLLQSHELQAASSFEIQDSAPVIVVTAVQIARHIKWESSYYVTFFLPWNLTFVLFYIQNSVLLGLFEFLIHDKTATC